MFSAEYERSIRVSYGIRLYEHVWRGGRYFTLYQNGVPICCNWPINAENRRWVLAYITGKKPLIEIVKGNLASGFLEGEGRKVRWSTPKTGRVRLQFLGPPPQNLSSMTAMVLGLDWDNEGIITDLSIEQVQAMLEKELGLTPHPWITDQARPRYVSSEFSGQVDDEDVAWERDYEDVRYG